MSELALQSVAQAMGVVGVAASVGLPGQKYYKLSGSEDSRMRFYAPPDVSGASKRGRPECGVKAVDKDGKVQPRRWLTVTALRSIQQEPKSAAQLSKATAIPLRSAYGAVSYLLASGLARSMPAPVGAHKNTRRMCVITAAGLDYLERFGNEC